MSKLIDESYIVAHIIEKSVWLDEVFPIDEGEARVIIATVLRCLDDLGYELWQKIDLQREDK